MITLINFNRSLKVTALSEKLFRLYEAEKIAWRNNEKEYLIKVNEGFEWDGATLFRAFWSITGYSRSGLLLAPSLAHDLIYLQKGEVFNCVTNEVEYISRKHCDLLFLEQMLAAGVPEKKARKFYQMIRLFGRFYWFCKHDYSL